MKTNFLPLNMLLIAMLFAANIYAQIPNEGFEQWSGNNPVSWVSGNAEGFTFVTPSGNPLSGQFAARLETKAILNNLVPAVLSAGAGGEGFPVSQRHGQLSFYYKFSKTVSTAYLYVSVGFKKGEEGIGAGVLAINASADSYTPVTIPVTYINNEIPDLGVILIQVTDQNLNPAASGSYAEIDDLSFSILTDVNDEEASVNDFSLEQNFPNPFNPSTKISWKSPVNGHQILKVYDIIGNEVATLVNEYRPAGSYEVDFNAANLPSGVYMYRLQAGDPSAGSGQSFVQTRKMTLIK
jgi:hypothetical protein